MVEKTQEFVLERIVRVKHNPFENRVIKIDNEAADEGRKQNPKRASGFSYLNGVFHVNGYYYLLNIGRSRGVRIGAENFSTGK